MGGALSDDVQFAFKGVLVGGQTLAAPDEDLPHGRLDLAGGLAQAGVVGGHDPPAEQRLAFLGDDAFDGLLALGALTIVRRQEDHADAVPAGRGQREALRAADAAQEGVGDLHQHPRAVAGVGLRADRAPVFQVFQDGQAILDNLVRRLPLHVDDEAYSAGVVFKPRVVQPLLGGQPVPGHA